MGIDDDTLVYYLVALALLIVSDFSLWVTMAFPVWVLVVSGLILARSRHIEERRAQRAPGQNRVTDGVGRS